MKTKKLINEALKDENSAPALYNKLKKSLSKKSDKKAISKIICQEKKHYKILKKIKKSL